MDTSSRADPVVSVEHLRKAYRDTVAVADVSFQVRRGEIFGILGRNGAGKTTTVECLQGLRRRDGGRLSVLGLDPGRDPGALRRRTGCQLQSSALPDRLRVAEAVRLFGRLRQRSVEVDATLAEWDLTGLRRRPFGALSGGQQQRVFLALALLGDPELVFLDELTTGLDPTARRATWQLVRQIRDRGTTIVLVTHFMEEAEVLCDRVAVVDRGRVVACGRPATITASAAVQEAVGVRVTFHADGYDARRLLTLPEVESVTTHAGEVTVTGHGPVAVRVATALAADGRHPVDYRTHYPSLEDAFLALTGRRDPGGDH